MKKIIKYIIHGIVIILLIKLGLILIQYLPTQLELLFK